MTPAARLSAAIDLISTIDSQRIPAAKALKEWGTAHRYAGSGDRSAIAGLVWDVLRRRASSAYLMDADTPRARVLGMLKLERGMDADTIAALCDGGRFAPEPLTEAERAALTTRTLDGAPPHVAGDYPEWLDLPVGGAVRRRARRRGRRDGQPCAARSARQYAEGQAR
jgi:16S rRNA (cytosine967-C5)-methyltransferase